MADGTKDQQVTTIRLVIHSAKSTFPHKMACAGKVPDGELAMAMTNCESAFLCHVSDKVARYAVAERGEMFRDLANSTTRAEAVELLSQERDKPGYVGAPQYNGSWVGQVQYVDGVPRIELARQLTAYLRLHIHGIPGQGWSAVAWMKPVWFNRVSAEKPFPLNSYHLDLRQAITQSIEAVTTGAVAAACSFRDTHRRAAVDAVYAEQHPIQNQAPKRTGVERFVKPQKAATDEPRSALIARADAKLVALRNELEKDRPRPGLLIHHAEVAVAKVNPPDEGLVRELERLKQEAAPAPKAPKAPKAAKAAKAPPLEDIPAPPVPSCPTSTANIADVIKNEAAALRTETESLWGNADDLLKRAGRLIQRAKSLAESPLCKGIEQGEAFRAINDAEQRYEEARKGFGGSDEEKRAVKQITERVSLAAAKAARACVAAGGALGNACAAVPAKSAKVTPQVDPPLPMSAYQRTPKPEAEPKKRGRKAAPAVDPQKDALLMASFKEALASAMAGLNAGATNAS